jgi:Fe-S-cluster containining protein
MRCLCCGTCCSKFQPRLNLDEAHDITQKLDINWEQFIEEYADSRWPGTRSFLLRHKNGACIFLRHSPDNKQKLCFIHDFKPACCRDWQANLSHPECQQGLKRIWKLTFNADGAVCGPQEEISRFNLYSKTNPD